MTGAEALVLGVVQGLTEFIPVSSSGHLVLMHHLLGVAENGLAFDVALHLGTLAALIIFFHQDIWGLLCGLLGKNDKRRLALLLALATIPAVVAGVLLQSAAESTFRSVRLVSIDLVVAAIFMLAAEKYAARKSSRTKLNQTSTAQAIIIGTAQAAAIVPGVSRSGATITAGLFAGMDRVAAMRFSFLLAIPITFGAILKVMLDGAAPQIQNESGIFAIGILAAFASGLFAIKFLLSYLSKHTLAAFAYYRIFIGLAAILLVSL